MKTVTIDGVQYVEQQDTREEKRDTKRAIVIVDRGWIFAGDVERADGRIRLSRAVWLFNWKQCGFSAVVADPSKADIRPLTQDVDIPNGAEIFSVPVPDDWGLK